MRGWKDYFQSLPSIGSGDMNITSQMHLQRLAAEGSRIFGGEGDIERWKINPNGSGAHNAGGFDDSLTRSWPTLQ